MPPCDCISLGGNTTHGHSSLSNYCTRPGQTRERFESFQLGQRIAHLSLILLVPQWVVPFFLQQLSVSYTKHHSTYSVKMGKVLHRLTSCDALQCFNLNHPNWRRIVSINHCQLWPGVAMSLLHHPQPIGSQEFQMQNRKKNRGPN